MSDSYAKLFSSLTTSTVWREPDNVRLVWITMLALKRRDHCVYASIPGLADAARVSIDATVEAIDRLMQPDKWSRTQTAEGRRIEPVDGGWRLINGAKHDAMRSADERREYMRKYKREQRAAAKEAKERVNSDVNSVNSVNRSHPTSTSTSSNTISKQQDQDQKHGRNDEAVSTAIEVRSRFEGFWKLYPRKVKKKEAKAVWQSKKLDAIADLIAEDVRNRADYDAQWLEGLKYIPHPTTYLRGERWNDDIQAPQKQPIGKTAGAILKLESMKFDEQQPDSLTHAAPHLLGASGATGG